MRDASGDEVLAMVFGRAADAYDTYRPSYPPEAVTWIAQRVQGRRAAEVGAGTGKATELFLAAGFEVVAVEPDPAMAAIGSRRAPGADWRVARAEAWDQVGAPFDLIYGAQSWHWVPQEADRRLGAALAATGAMAWMWNRPDDDDDRALLRDVYAEYLPEIASTARRRLHRRDDRHWIDRLAAVADGVEASVWPWATSMSTADYVALTGTYSDHLALPAGRRRQLHDAIAARIDEEGGRLHLRYRTHVYLGRIGAH